MNEHEHNLALATASIDFPLSHEDAATLTRHLAACPTCAATVALMREDVAALAAIERTPAPPRVRQAVVRAATGGRSPVNRGAGLRWSLVAAVLALLAVGGTFVAGAVLERMRDERPAPTDPTTVLRPTPEPAPTDDQAPRRTATPLPSGSWKDLGDLTDAFGGRIIDTLAAGDGLVAIGRDQGAATPLVWLSRDGLDWTLTEQPEDVFGGRVPTAAAYHDGRWWVVGWDIAVTGAQRAIWSSTDGAAWSRVDDPTALLGTETSDLELVAGPAGLLVWAPDGRIWTSTDGARWDRSDIGVNGVTDAAVDDATFSVVGRDGDRAFVVSSTDGVDWSDPATRDATGDAQVGIERDVSGSLLAWIGDRPFEVTRDGWRDRPGAAAMPSVASPQDVVGRDGFAAIGAPTSQGVQRAWVGDGTRDWSQLRSDPASGARTVVGMVGGDGAWYVLTRQGTTYRGWSLVP